MISQRVFTNCRVHTLDASNTVVDAIAVSQGRIVALGSQGAARFVDDAKSSDTKVSVVDLGGRTVVPGLIDSHAHLIDYGLSSTRAADLSGCGSIREVQTRLRSFREANPLSDWLLGTRFDQELFEERRWITRRDLDEVSTDVPIMVSRLCLHAVVLNSKALEMIEGGLSLEQRETGLLAEDAAGLAWQQVPSPARHEHIRAAKWALLEARRVGLCGVHCVVESREDLDLLIDLDSLGPLPIRVQAMCPAWMLDNLQTRGIGPGAISEYLKIGPAKVFMDGSMGARTAAMREPYSDDPKNHGQLFRNERELAGVLERVQELGYQAGIHAIGDMAVECALAGIELASSGQIGNSNRHRIEHASQMSSASIREMARLGVIACVQPQFVITDFWTRERVGPERYRWSYPFRSMMDSGITLAMGSDCPVERLDPIELIDRAVNREPHSLAERLSVEEVLRCYTWGSAHSGFDESRLGSLEVGKLADFSVMSADPLAVPAEGLGALTVVESVVGGSVV